MLPESGHRFGVLHMLDDKLTIFGGTDSVIRKVHSKVTTYNSQTNNWYNKFPDMLNKRFMPGIITYKSYVCVMGGKSGKDSIHDSIEVMDYQKKPLQWKEISVCLPTQMWHIKPTISEDYVIIVGYGHSVGQDNGYYQIAVEDLCTSFDQPFGRAVSTQWKKLSSPRHFDTATVPNTYPPVILGGNDVNGVATSDISLYDTSNKTWMKVSSLTSARDKVGVAVLNSNCIIVIGGTSGSIGANTAEAASIATVEMGYVVFNQQYVTNCTSYHS